jgi:hypothetical protein
VLFTKRHFRGQVRLLTLAALVFFAPIPALAVEAPDGLMTELLEYPEQTIITDTLPFRYVEIIGLPAAWNFAAGRRPQPT